MRVPDFSRCKNKGADQLCSNCIADQCLCVCYTDSTFLLNPQFQASSLFCDCLSRFVSEMVKNPVDWFSRIAGCITCIQARSVAYQVCRPLWVQLSQVMLAAANVWIFYAYFTVELRPIYGHRYYASTFGCIN